MISIIIPAYNEEKYIEKTLLSLQQQTFRDFEIIVVANGCSDGTIQVARLYTTKIFDLKEPKASRARNVGARASEKDILVFLDADTVLAADALDQIVRQFSSGYTVATLHSHPNTSRFVYVLMLEFKNFLHMLGVYHGSLGVIITRKRIFRQVGGFEEDRTIRENSSFIRKAEACGKYKVIRHTCATTSMRRYERWGLFKTIFFWGKNWMLGKKEARYEAVR